ncbi:PAS domain S-box-containing protein [Duganella sp. 1224]|uniref:PAS domain-containing sensor histidine kinase n=1 Tax=Duganella sp. 1224 TaxID=2587052 RepID=UPI0015CBDFC9|nr:PAS domain S-box protein [Duganella sp. 1224]NYE61019.1 PAS domain S-box-containing protein [Duganella sp. 1224]
MTTDFGTLILQQTPDAVVVTTTGGEVACWTNGAQAVFGYTSEEAVGRQLDALIVPPGDAAGPARQTLARDQGSYESMRQAKDGTLIYVDSSYKLIPGDGSRPDYILWSKKDVTALKVLRDAKLLEARYDGILESMPDAIIIANAAGRIVLANGQAEALFGYPRHALRGMVLENLMPARYRSAHLHYRAGFAAQPLVRPMGRGRELYGLRSDGVEFPVEISLSPVGTEEGTLVMSAIRDISERKQFELALQEKNVELAKAVAAKDRFLAGMSHELRTPLNAIIGFTGTMLMKLPGPINDEQAKQLRMVQSSARQLLSLINDLLELTRIDSGKIELDRAPLSCKPLIDEVLNSFKSQARSKGLALEFELPPEEVTVAGDRRAVQQILMNLVHNAIKFTNNGKVLVRLAKSVVGERACATISVADTGIGIGDEQRGTLFQAFSQLDGNALRQFEGTGLGLHLSRKLAALLHGEILFDSEYGKGSVFTLALPLEE